MSTTVEKPLEISHVENTTDKDVETTGDEKGKWLALTEDAKAANLNEHEATPVQAIRAYPWALMWSLIVSMAIIMEGYDMSLINNFFGYPAFQKQFGNPYKDGYEVPGPWQSALASGAMSGSFIGAFLNGFLIKHFGFKRVFMFGLVLMNAFVFFSFFGTTVQLQTVGQVLCGVRWGIFATIGPAYSSELCPLAFRPYLTAYTNMCFAIGQFIAAGVLQGLIDLGNQWSYRIPFAIQWIWPAPLFVVAFFMPESPWWLVRKGHYDKAERTVKRLTTGPEREKSRQIVAMMIHTNDIESEVEAGSSYLDCYRGTNARRTEIACVTFAGQVLAGSQFAYSGTYFFLQAGMSPEESYKLGLGGTAIAFIGTIIAWFLMKAFGRRTTYLWGMGSMAIYLLIIGFLTLGPVNGAKGWAQAALCIIWLFSFSLSVGPIGWTVPAEVSSTRLRSKTICLARNSYYLAIIAANAIQPYMMNPTELDWKGKTGFFWFAFASLTWLWAYFRLVESKGRTFEELDILFAARVPTRKFKTHHVDAYAEDVAIADRAKAQ